MGFIVFTHMKLLLIGLIIGWIQAQFFNTLREFAGVSGYDYKTSVKRLMLIIDLSLLALYALAFIVLLFL